MPSIVQQFFTNQALHLRHGRFDQLSGAYAVPLVVMLPSDDRTISVLPSRAAVENFFRAKFDGLGAAGIEYLRAMVTDVEAVSERRFAATVIWYYLDPAGARQGETTARYFLGKRTGGLVVEMIEFRRLAFDAIADWVGQYDRRVPAPEMRTRRT